MSLFKKITKSFFIAALLLTVGVNLTVGSQDEGSAPTLKRIVFSPEFDADGEGERGILVFNDPDRDLVKAEFNVIESVDLESFELDLTTYNGPPEGAVEFFISTTTPQRVTMEVVLVDAQELRSEPQEFSFRAITLEPRTLHVPSEYESPAIAVRFARDGDTIEFAEGTYTRVELDVEKSITLQGEAGTRPVLDGSGDTVMTIDEGAEVVLKDFVITNGSVGLFIFDGATVSLDSMEITQSRVGLYALDESKVTLTNTKVFDNVHNSSGNAGEGFVIEGNAEVLIENSEFRNNFEAGVMISGSANVTVRNSVIADTQEANSDVFARGISVGNTAILLIEDSEIVGNANLGVFAWGESHLTVRNSRIADSKLDTENADGRGLTIRGTAEALIENSEIDNNHDNGFYIFDAASVTIRDSIIANTRQIAPLGEDEEDDTGGRGITIFEDARLLIENTTITSNATVGIFAGDDANITVRNNIIEKTRSSRDGVGGRGINLQVRSSALIENNTFMSNGEYAIVAGDDSQAIISGNTVERNAKGIRVGFWISEDEAVSAQLTDNVIRNNNLCGLEINADYASLRVTGSDNVISDNSPDFCIDDYELPFEFLAKVELTDDLVYEERFGSAGSGWQSNQTWSYASGEYRAFLSAQNTIGFSSLPDRDVAQLSDVCVQFDVRALTSSGLASEGLVGFYFARTLSDNGTLPSNTVFIGLDYDGSVTAVNVGPNGLGSTISKAERAVEDVARFNTVLIRAERSQYKVYVNGREFFTARRTSSQMDMGLMAISKDQPNLNARFDNVKISESC